MSAVARRAKYVPIPFTPDPLYYLLRPFRLLFSFEFILATLTVIGGIKKNPSFAWLFPVDATALIFVLVACVFILEIVKNGIPRYAILPASFYILFCLWTIASSFWSVAPSLQPLPDFIQRVMLINGLMFFGTLFIVARSQERIIRFFAALSFFGFLLGINYAIQLGSFSSRIVPEDTQYNIVGAAVSSSFVIVFGYMLYTPIFTRGWTLYMIGIAILSYTSILIGSRQNFVAMIAQAILLMLFLAYLRRGQIKIHVGLLPAIGFGIMALFAIVFIIQSGLETRTISRLSRLFGYIGGSETDQSSITRMNFLVASVGFWLDSVKSILFGDGVFSFSGQLRGTYLEGVHPHNLIMNILTEFGLVGLAFYILTLVHLVPFKRTVRAIRGAAATIVIALVVGSLFRGLASGTIGNSQMILVSMALLPALQKLSR